MKNFDENIVVAIDYDGTITEKDRPTILNASALYWVRKIQETGATTILWTCREGKLLEEALIRLKNENIFFDFVNEGNGERPFSRKINADVYIDDRSVLSEIDWKSFYKMIQNKVKEREEKNVPGSKENGNFC